MAKQPPETLDSELRAPVSDRRAYAVVLDRLSKASVDRHWEPYIDIPWNDPGYRIDPDDRRWTLTDTDRLDAHPWYKAQPPEIQSRIGLWRVATAMKTGMQFENLLKRGLLAYAYNLPNGSPEFRYVYHETIEEGHHGMMFQEFVNRAGFPIHGMPRPLRRLALISPLIPRLDPELFFFFVLGGEDPIDYVQRRTLRSGGDLHPLQERIMRIHVAEEARHISFARSYLRSRVPRLGWVHRRTLGVTAPVILGVMAHIMLGPSRAMIREFGIPRHVLSEAYRKSPAARAETRACVAKVRELAGELGLITPVSKQIWKLMGIWAEAGQAC